MKKAPPNIINWRGAQIPRNDSYLAYVEEAGNATQQRIWTFCEAVNYLVFTGADCK